MPTDLGLIIANLTAFYDFRNKVVVHVGAGGGQLLGYARSSRKVLAVDRDPAAVRRLEEKVAEQELGETVTVVTGDFHVLDLQGDVVLFEFCLHEMPNPRTAIDHARAITSDIVVIDHLPESEWARYANEEKDMARAWEAVAAARPRREESFQALQCFGNHGELRARFSGLGQESLRRISVLQEQAPIAIPMPYRIALL